MAGEVEFQDEGIQALLTDLADRLAQIEDGNRKYGGLLSANVFRDIMDHFEQQEGSEGKWKQWSFWYTQQMEKNGKGGNKILQDTGRLRQRFKPQNWRSVKNGYLWFNNAQTKSGFPYAAAHDEGGERLPKRDFMWLSDNTMEEIAVQTLLFLMDEEGQ